MHAISVRPMADADELASYIEATHSDDPLIVGVPPNETIRIEDLAPVFEGARAAGRDVALWVTAR
jgi:hypothetical protein